MLGTSGALFEIPSVVSPAERVVGPTRLGTIAPQCRAIHLLSVCIWYVVHADLLDLGAGVADDGACLVLHFLQLVAQLLTVARRAENVRHLLQGPDYQRVGVR